MTKQICSELCNNPLSKFNSKISILFAWSEIYLTWMRKSYHPGYANTTERAQGPFKMKCNWRFLECQTELCREKIIHILQFLIIIIKSLFRTNKVNFSQFSKEKLWELKTVVNKECAVWLGQYFEFLKCFVLYVTFFLSSFSEVY